MTELSHPYLWGLFFTNCALKDLKHFHPSALNCPGSKFLSAIFLLVARDQPPVFSFLSNCLSWICFLAFRLIYLFAFITSHLIWPVSPLPHNTIFPRSNFFFLPSWLLDPECFFVNIFVQILFFEVSLGKRYLLCFELAKASFCFSNQF